MREVFSGAAALLLRVIEDLSGDSGDSLPRSSREGGKDKVVSEDRLVVDGVRMPSAPWGHPVKCRRERDDRRGGFGRVILKDSAEYAAQ